MNKSVLMIMGGALAVALLVAMVVQSRLGGHDKSSGTEILVANKKLHMGEKIKPADVRWQSWPEAALFKGVIRRSEQKDEKKLSVYDAPLRRTVEAGEPVTEQSAISDAKGAKNFLAASIRPGLRAVSVAVRPETAVAGFVGPGDYVDVILSYQPKITGELQQYSADVVQNYASETILSNVRVLAVDQNVKGEDREAKTVKTVTLEVTRPGAETLYLAEKMGEISFSLRRMGDKDGEQEMKSSLTTDMSRSAVIRRVEKIRDKEKTSSDTVRVYSGTGIQNVPVRTGTDSRGDQP
jgi:pilus assembly protein CpaB